MSAIARILLRLLCLLGRHDWYNDGVVYYSYAHGASERLVQRCNRDYCWRVRFL